MPSDPGPTTWVEGQYRKFLEGVDQVGTNNAARLARSQAKVRVEPGKSPTINLPGWDDIVRVGPRTPVTPEDWAIQRHFERGGLQSPLDPAVQKSIGERRAMARRIANSATPEYQRGFAVMMTAVDNVQDAALTASVGTRVAIPALGRFGAVLAPASAAFGVLATALGWLNLGVFGLGALYALACRGPRAAIAALSVPALAAGLFEGLRGILPRRAGMPFPGPTSASKGRMAAAMLSTPGARNVASAAGGRWGKMRISFAEALQIGQTAYDVTGYGVALGAVMGFVSETAYGAARAQQGERVRVRSPEVNHAFAEIIGPRIAKLGRGALWHREQCARALASAPLILRDPEFWGPELYGLTWLVLYTSIEPLMWDTHGLTWREAVIERADAHWYAWDVRDVITEGILAELPKAPAGPAPFPVPGSPLTLSTEQLVLEIGPEIGRALQHWLDAAPMDPWRRLLAELSTRVSDRFWYWLEGTQHWPRWELSPTAAVWESLWRADRWPIVSDPPDAIMRAWQSCEAYVRSTGVKYIDTPVLDQLWDQAGSPLLRITGGDGAMPIEHLLPWDESTGGPTDEAYGLDLDQARARLEQLRQASGSANPDPHRAQ